jgi:hypothetical protein
LSVDIGPIKGQLRPPRWVVIGRHRPTGPDLLRHGAALLSTVVDGGPVWAVDIHAVLYLAAVGLRAGRDRPHRLRLADEAVDLFVGYLVASGRAAPAVRVSGTLRGWLGRRGWEEVSCVLSAAADHWADELAKALVSPA